MRGADESVRAARALAGVALALMVAAGFGAGSASQASAAAGAPNGVYRGQATVTGVQPNPDANGEGLKVGESSEGRIKLSCNGPSCTISGFAGHEFFPSGTTLTGGGGTWRGSLPVTNSSDCPPFRPTKLVLTGDADQVTLTTDRTQQRVDCSATHYVERSGLQTRFTGALEGSSAPTTSGATPSTSQQSGSTSTKKPQGKNTRVAGMSSYQRASLAAVARGDRSTVAASLTTPGDATHGGLRRAAANGLIAGALVLLLAFPSTLFNSTYNANQKRVDAFVRSRLPRLRGPAAATAQTAAPASDGVNRIQVVVFLAVAAGGAILGQFLDPHAGFDTKTAALFTGIFVSTLVGVAVGAGVGRTYRTARRQPTAAVLRSAPVGLLIAAACVVVSRAVHFQPGYLYGLIGGLAFTAAMSKEDDGRHELVHGAVGIAVALVAWGAFVPVAHAANHANAGFPVLSADALLSAMFIGGIEGILLSLTPLQFLPGYRLARWSWAVWACMAFVAAFTFVHVLLRPSTGYLGASTTASVTVTVALFLGFGAASVGFWAWFKLHPDRTARPHVAVDTN